MKKCPFCAEEIQDAAIKCRYCGSSLPAVSPTHASIQQLGIEGIQLTEAAPRALGQAEQVAQVLHERDQRTKREAKTFMQSCGCLLILLSLIGVGLLVPIWPV